MPKYKNNFLAKVIFRLDFPENILLGSLDDFAKAINTNFPTKEEKTETSILFNLTPESDNSKNKIEKNSFWLFHSTDKKKRLCVGMRYIYLEYDRYNDFLEVETDIKESIVKFLTDFNIKIINRVGFRYINEIKLREPNQLEWKELINPSLISVIDYIKDKRPARIMGQFVVKEELGDLMLNYGIWNKEYPNEINEKEFVLDFDCHSGLGIASDEILNIAQSYHSYIENFFEDVIEQKLRDKMNI